MTPTTTTTAPRTAEPRATIDPRIRARRIAIRRDEGRRRLRRLQVSGGVALAVALAVGATQTPLLDVNQISVTGASHTTPVQIQRASGISRGDQLISLDLGRAEHRVDAMPWVASAKVSRTLGGEIAIDVVERVPAATLSQATTGQAEVLLVDASGRVLATAPATPAGLVTIEGVPDKLVPGAVVPEHVRGALQLATRLATDLPGRASAVVVGDELLIRLGAKGVIRVGTVADLDAKLLAIVTVLQEVDSACLATLDVRLPKNPVLTREQRCR